MLCHSQGCNQLRPPALGCRQLQPLVQQLLTQRILPRPELVQQQSASRVQAPQVCHLHFTAVQALELSKPGGLFNRGRLPGPAVPVPRPHRPAQRPPAWPASVTLISSQRPALVHADYSPVF